MQHWKLASIKDGKRTYGKKHERKYAGRIGRKSFRTWFRANGWREHD